MKLLFLRLFNKAISILYSFINVFNTNSITVLMMHEIIENDVSSKNPMQLHYKDFKVLLDILKSKKKAISLLEFYDCFTKGRFNGEYIITFDDVHQSVYQMAYPLLIENNIPFTLFVNLSLLDTLGYISKEQLIKMSLNSLCTIGSHGVNHIYHRSLSDKESFNELCDSKKTLEKTLKLPVHFFAFPYGSLVAVSFRNIKQLIKTDYLMSFSTIQSSVNNSSFISKRFIPRINVTKKIIDNI